MSNAANKNIYIKRSSQTKQTNTKKKTSWKESFYNPIITNKIHNNLQTNYNKLIDKLYPIKYEPQQF